MGTRLLEWATLTTLVVALCSSVPAAVPDTDEPPPTFKASALLAPSVVKGAHYEVGEAVRTDGYFHEFTLSSPFGAFEAVGRSQLTVRIQEIDALAALDDVSKTEVFLKAAGQSVVKVGQGVAAVVKDPTEAAKGLGAGVKRFGVNLGRRTQRAVESADDSSSPDSDAPPKGSAAESAAKSVLGVSSAMRRWASKVGVDPYTTNAVLRDALESIAKVDAAGSIATKVVLPIPAVVGMTSKVSSLVWGKDPEELRKINEQRLRDLTVPEDVARALFANGWFTLTYQTRLIAALHTVRAPGCADYVKTAAEGRSEREALFFVEGAEMLETRHAREPIVGVLTDSRALVAKLRSGKAVALLPLDWIRWTAASDKAVREIAARARDELSAKQLQIALTGRVSERASRELRALGWTLAKPS
jgi:hypothetical protein